MNSSFPGSDDIVVEGMTSVSAVVNSVYSGKDDRLIKTVFVSKNICSKKTRELSFLKSYAEKVGYAIEFVDDNALEELTSGVTHGGICAVCGERHLPALSPKCVENKGIFALLDGIEDPYNYAYTVRSLYAAGFDGIVLPPRNWSSADALVIKSSAGTSELIETYVCEPTGAVGIFKSAGYQIVCAGIRDSVSLFEADLKAPLLLIIGGEKRGISRSLIDLSDMTVRIDYGRKFIGSLTTASSASVIAFEIMRQNRK